MAQAENYFKSLDQATATDVFQLIVVFSVALSPRFSLPTILAKCTLQTNKSHADYIFYLCPYRASEFNKHNYL